MNHLLVSIILLFVCVGCITSQMCYVCSNCPTPFYPDPTWVSKQQSYTGFCAKKSTSSYPGAQAGRGPAEPGLCSYSGCGWKYDGSGRQFYTCCCRSNYCNTGNYTSKSIISVLLGALAVLAFNRYF